MSTEEKFKQLFNLLEVENAVDEGVQEFITESGVELTEEDVKELRKFLLDIIITNLTECVTKYFSEDEITQVVSHYSNKKLMETLTKYERVVFEVMYKIKLGLQRFLNERDLMKQTRFIDKKDLN